MHGFLRRVHLAYVLPIAMLIALAALVLLHVIAAVAPGPVAAAWEQARVRGAYSFNADITQMTMPVATATNVGRSARTDRFMLSGDADVRAERMNLRLWSNDGSTAAPQSGIELLVENGKTKGRQQGGPWRELSGTTQAVAPQGDMLAYLAAVRDVRELGHEERAGRTFTRYAFVLDGPRLAEYLRDQLQTQLRNAGQLPPGVDLKAADAYVHTEGEGELWVDAQGLPLRQIIDLRFPERGGERVGAHITVDFSQFAASGRPTFGSIPLDSIASLLFVVCLGMACIVGMIRFGQSRLVGSTLAVIVSGTLVAGPLISSQRVRTFFEAQKASAAEQQRSTEESDMTRAMRTLAANKSFDPHADPLAAAPSATIPQPAAPQAVVNPTGDDDGDTLTNAVEAYLGTSSSTEDANMDGVPDGRDSDGDLLDDDIEIKGFTWDGKPWHTDPLQNDSNGDGLSDTQEWPVDREHVTAPPDTDGDGVPDVFDRDNDNDGVPDTSDLSPQRTARPGDATSVFSEHTPLRVSMNNLAQGTLALLDLQLRPADPKQLWFSQSVLDWPIDRRGQLQDGDGGTYADLARATGRVPDVNEGDGDMKLVPMLEIRAANGDGIPAQSVLTPYNIAVSTNQDGTRLYAPLSLVSDQETGARVAFNTRIPYLAGVQPQEIRLVWAVQMLVDVCKTGNGDGECTQYDPSKINTPQIIQTYYEPWMLTGAAVREDHGVGITTIYEDPSAPDEKDLRNDDTLWLLSHGLDSSFLGGRTDLNLAEITRRFDRLGNGAVSAEQRWGLSNTLRAETHTYKSLDEAIMTTAMTTTKQLLNTQFSSRWSASDANPIKPLIMFAREERFRAVSLDGLGDGHTSQTGASLTFDMNAGGTLAPLLLQRGLSWSAFCGAPSAGGASEWSTCPSEDYWQEIEDRYAGRMAQPGDTPDMTVGRLRLAQLYFLSLAQGGSRIVASNESILKPGYVPLSDQATLSLMNSVRSGAASTVSGLLNIVIMAKYVDKISVLEYLGNMFKQVRAGKLGQLVVTARTSLINKLGYKFGSTAFGVAVFALVAALTVGIYFLMKYYLAGNQGAKIAFSALLAGLSGVLAVVLPLFTIKDWISALKAGGIAQAARTAFTANSAVTGTARAATVIGAIVAVLIVWGFFIYSIVTTKTTAFSPSFNRAFAEAIASTIYIIITALLSATVIGLLIVGIISLIDSIFTVACEAGADILRTVPGLGGACFSIGTSATKLIAKLLYSFDVMVNTAKDDLIITGVPRPTLKDTSRGYVAGNELSIQLPITTTVTHKSPAPENWMHIIPYLWMFSEDNLRTSTFQYTLSRQPEELHADRSQMNSAWNVSRADVFGAQIAGIDFGKTLYRAQTSGDHVAFGGLTLPIGLNKQLDLTLNTGFAIPAYECWAVPNPVPIVYPPLIPVCYTRTVDGHFSKPLANQIQFDILPTTLAGFRELTDDGNSGFKLKWDAAFTGIADADNDGLRSTAFGGFDPNDATWDADGDGLSDALEIDRRQAGLGISPTSWDSDNDGLTDAQELELGTSPVHSDTDNDGLRDGDEVWHQAHDSSGKPTSTWTGGWDIAVPGLGIVHVNSDPTQADADGDGLTDQAERGFALSRTPDERLDPAKAPYNPNVFNTSPVNVYTTVSDPDLVVRPGQSVVVTTTTVLSGNVALAGGGVVSTSSSQIAGLPFAFPLNFNGGKQSVSVAPVTVAANAPSGDATVTSTLQVRLPKENKPEFAWEASQINPVRTFKDRKPRWTAIASADPSRQDSYVLSTQAVSASLDQLFDPKKPGDMPTFDASGGSLDLNQDNRDTQFLLGSSGSRVNCNNSGNCMVVWSRYNNCNSVILSSLTVTKNEDEPDTGADIELYFRRNDTSERQEIGYAPNIPDKGEWDLKQIPFLPFCGNGALEIWDFDGYNKDGSEIHTKVDEIQIDINDRYTIDSRFSGGGSSGRVIEGSVTRSLSSNIPYTIARAMVGPSDTSATVQDIALNNGNTIQEEAAAIASNGVDFLVAWKRTTEDAPTHTQKSQVVMQRFNSAGQPVGNFVQLSLLPEIPLLALDVAWIGDAYRVIWRTSDGKLRAVDIDVQGSLLGGVQELAVDLNPSAGDANETRISYDPLSKHFIIIYGDSINQVRARVYTSRSDSGKEILVAYDALAPQVAYHPIARAWLVGWSSIRDFQSQSYRLINPDGTARDALTPPSVRWPNNPTSLSGMCLACPSINSVPVVELPFEEFPGVSSFVDTSGYGGTTSCAPGNCPKAGAVGAGASVAPQSDFAVAFDGKNQSLSFSPAANTPSPAALTVAFWFKTEQKSGRTTLLNNANYNFTLADGKLSFTVGGSNTANASVNVADGRWHFAAGSVSASATQLFISDISNTLAAFKTNGTALGNNALNLTIGGQTSGFFNGAIDQLQIYPSAMSQDTVKTLFDRTIADKSYCKLATPDEHTIQTATLKLTRNDVRGGLITRANAATLRIDGDAATSLITAPSTSTPIAATGGATTLVIGGSASDPSSDVARVEVSVNNGPFELATGTAAWSYAAVLAPGRNRIVTRATDVAGNVETPGAGIVVQVDDAAPTAAFDAARITGPVAPIRLNDGSWSVQLGGTLADPQSGGQPGSGVDPATVSVELEAVTPVAGAAQGIGRVPASFNGTAWNATYVFPSSMPEPSGVFTATLRAADRAGNPTTATARVALDAAGPDLILSDTLHEVAVITTTATISGTTRDATGTSAVEARLLPIAQVAPLAAARMLLTLDEPAGALRFDDRTTDRNDAVCAHAPCPTAGEPGRVDSAVRFSTPTELRVAPTGSVITGGLTLQTWVQASGGDGRLVADEGDASGTGRGYGLRLAEGYPTLDVDGQPFVSSIAINDAAWHHLAGVVDQAAKRATLYVDGQVVASGDLGSAAPLGGGALRIGGFDGLLDEIALIESALNPAQVQALMASADTPWRAAMLDGSAQNWTLPLPADLEGQFQLDLRGVDMLGTHSFTGNAWRVVIDNLAPRLNLSREATGHSFVSASGERNNEITYRYDAHDEHLDGRRFSGPCDAVAERSFADLTALNGLLGDLTVRDGLRVQCTRWEPVTAVPATASACDTFNSCTVATFPRIPSADLTLMRAARAVGSPQAVVTSPAQGEVAIAAADGSMPVTIAADASAGLATVVIDLDGTTVTTIDLSDGDAMQRVVRSVMVRTTEGQHTLTVRATDRAGATQGEPAVVHFSVDTAAPSVTLDADRLDADDLLTPGSGMLHLSGTATDTLDLAAVQVRINDGAFSDATLRPDGTWSTTRWFGWGAEGKQYSVTLRAIDRAGRSTDVTRNVLVDVPAVQTLETTISTDLTANTKSLLASFSFSGVAAAGRTVAGFRCKLNDGPVTPCSSPQRYSNLSGGDQRFQVYAVDDQGITDSTPAEFNWTIENRKRAYLPAVWQ